MIMTYWYLLCVHLAAQVPISGWLNQSMYLSLALPLYMYLYVYISIYIYICMAIHVSA